MSLRETLHALAEEAPAVRVPDGLFDRAHRRRRRRRWAAAGTAAVVLALSGYGLSVPARHPQPAAAPPGLPAAVFDPPAWLEEFSGSPNGPASLVFWGPAVPGRALDIGFDTPMAVVGLTDDTYRGLYPPQPSLALSPDGRTLLLPVGNGSGMNTDALDLVTGRHREVAADAQPVSWSPDGAHALLVRPDRWKNPDAPAETINDMTVTVLAWPSARAEWSVHIARPEAVEGETNFFLALSPDAGRLAVSTSSQLRVYGRDGTLLWQRATGTDLLAGPAAWRADGRLAVLRRDGTPSPEASDWRLAFVDAATGAPAPGPAYPVVTGAFNLRVVAWRGETAYAISRSTPDRDSGELRAAVLRLTPGAAVRDTLVALPAGVSDVGLATDYVDVVRPAGAPAFGLSLRRVLADALPVSVVLVALAVGVWVWRRYRRRPV